MNLVQNYDAVEGKDGVEPRAIQIGDLLQHIEDRDHYLVGAPTCHEINLINIATGVRWTERVPAKRMSGLTRGEASALCASKLHCFRLVGRANDVLTVQDPENSP